MTEYKDPYHFKAGFYPKCPHCNTTEYGFAISLDEHLYGPCNGAYEVIYCKNPVCHAFITAVPTSIMNLQKGIPEEQKIEFPNEYK